jgi:hypothetical protein
MIAANDDTKIELGSDRPDRTGANDSDSCPEGDGEGGIGHDETRDDRYWRIGNPTIHPMIVRQ